MSATAPVPVAPDRAARILVWVSVAAGLALTGVLALDGLWLPASLMGVATLGAALAPVLPLPAVLAALLAVASTLNGASIAWNWYRAWEPFDEWAHFLNLIVLVAPSMVLLHGARFVPARTDGRGFLVAAAAYGFVLAVGWEVIESFIWVFPVWDTVSDVLLGVGGSILGGWWAGRLIRAGSEGAADDLRGRDGTLVATGALRHDATAPAPASGDQP